MKRGLKYKRRLPLSILAGWVVLLWAAGGCSPSAETLAHNTLAAMSQTALAAQSAPSATPPVLDLTAEATTAATTTALIEPGESSTPWVWINLATETPAVQTLPAYATFTATPTPTITTTPTRGPSPRNTRQPTATSTITATAKPPSAALRIDTPGEGSRILSPFQFQAAVTRGEDNLVQVFLLGEDGHEFYAETLDYRHSQFNWLLVTPSLTFDIATVAENARLVLQTHDAYGRLLALSSVDVVLLSIGANQINPAQHPYAPFLIDAPAGGDEIRGSRMIVSGRAAPLNEKPVIIELLDEDGQVLAQREMFLDPPAAGETYTPFTVELALDMDHQINARLTIRQESANSIPGTIALSSIALTLLP